MTLLIASACTSRSEMVADGGDTEATQETSAEPVSARRVFLTSETFNGNLGGLIGADAHCQRIADQQALGGTYRAWLSDALESPSTRFVHGTRDYELLDGTLIAEGWADLVDGSLRAGISITEDESIAFDPIEVWTNTRADGTAVDASVSCEGWTSAEGLPAGGFGDSTEVDQAWTHRDGTNCNTWLRLYCFEQ